MRILVACEFSGKVREAFRRRGHDAFSCDIEKASDGSEYHFREDVLNVINLDWDMMIAFPPCTHLCASGARWWKIKKTQQLFAIEFVKKLWDAPIKKICIENPIGILSTVFRKPDQIISPHYFGHEESKKTCLWLKNLPLLKKTKKVLPWEERIHRMPESPNRSKERSITYSGVAEAMASQWG